MARKDRARKVKALPEYDPSDRTADLQHRAISVVGKHLAALSAECAKDEECEKKAVNELIDKMIHYLNTMTYVMDVGNAPPVSLLQSTPLKWAPAAETPSALSYAYTGRTASCSSFSGGYDTSSSQRGQSNNEPPAKPDTKTRTDWRILIPLDSGTIDREAQLMSPRSRAYAVRQRIFKVANLSPDSLTVSITRSSYAVHTHTKAAFDTMMRYEIRNDLMERFCATSVGPLDRWTVYEVRNVPEKLLTLGNDVIASTTESHVSDEARLQTGQQPVRCRKSWDDRDPCEGDRSTWILTFCQEVEPFLLFEESSMSREIIHTPRIGIHDPGCQQYCDPARCSLPARCNRCSGKLTEHDSGPCIAPPCCTNCCGPYLTGHDNCPAVPVRRNGQYILTKRQRNTVTSAGRKMYMASVLSMQEEPTE